MFSCLFKRMCVSPMRSSSIIQLIKKEAFVIVEQSNDSVVLMFKRYNFCVSWDEKRLLVSIKSLFVFKEEDIFPAMVAAHSLMNDPSFIRIYVNKDEHKVIFDVIQFCYTMSEFRSLLHWALDMISTVKLLFTIEIDDAKTQ